MRYLRLFEVFNRSGKCPLWDVSTLANICRAFVWSGKCPSGICLVGEVSIGNVPGRGSVRRGCVRESRWLLLQRYTIIFAERNENDENYMVKWLNVVWGREFPFISVKVIASINFKVFQNPPTQSANCHKKWSSELFCMHVLTKYNFKERSLNTSTSTEKSNNEFFFKTI